MEAMTVCARCGDRSQGRPLICPRCGEDPRVQGRYRLEGELGRGGSAVTWRARREPSGEPVCLKELRWATMGSLEDERRFAREGELLEGLDHPAIPKHYGAFSWGEGRAHAGFIAQELVVGESLDVERRSRGYTDREILETGADLADVLVYLHGRHPPVVHRDLKPSNIMRRVDGRLVLIDFGAARVAGLGQSEVSVAGTFGFMAPEQIRGEAGPPADVYGLGMTLAVLLAGGPPEALLDAQNRPDMGRISGLRADLRALLDDMCALDAAARPSAEEVARRCREMSLGPRRIVVVAPPPANPVAAAPPRASATARVIVLMAVSIIAATVGFVAITITTQVTDTVKSAMQMTRSESATTSSSWTITSTSDKPPVVIAAAPPAPLPVEPPVDPLGLLAEGCAAGQQVSCGSLAEAATGSQRDKVGALPGWPTPLARGCEQHIADACHGLALVYAQGIGVTSSAIEARRYFGKACEAGSLDACNSYGHMLLKGQGGPSDWGAALPPLDKACSGGDDDACLSVGAIFAEGKLGAKADRPKALGIFEGLCQKGQHAACENIDAMVGNNWGLPASGAARIAALDRLCGLRSGAACEKLGDAFARGNGVKKDPAKAREAYTKGCDAGSQSACQKMR